jgi:hypothetical protein
LKVVRFDESHAGRVVLSANDGGVVPGHQGRKDSGLTIFVGRDRGCDDGRFLSAPDASRLDELANDIAKCDLALKSIAQKKPAS